MKKLLLFSMMCLMALSMQAQKNTSSKDYVDLGLPSGTLWKSSNEKGGLVTYYEAVQRYGDNLPTQEQWAELKGMCKWSWTGKGYKVTGLNGKSIVLPASGARDCDGVAGAMGSFGGCWSSTPIEAGKAWSLLFDSHGNVKLGDDECCYGRSVRLVQNQ